MKTWKEFLLLNISLFFVPFKAQNCADYPMNSAIQVNHVLPDLLPITELFQFVYDLDYSTHSSDFLEHQLSLADQENLNEWLQKFPSNSVSKNAIYFFLYRISNTDFCNNKDHWRKNNPALAWAWENDKELATYMEFAKSRHAFGKQEFNWWIDFTIPTQNNNNFNLDELLNSSKDPWIKRRYAYWKIIDLFYFALNNTQDKENNHTKEIERIWNDNFAGKNKDWLYYSALHYYAQFKSDLDLFDCFIYGSDKRSRIASLLTASFIDSLYRHSNQAKYKATARVIKELRNPGKSLDGLRELIQLDPNNRDLNFLLIREINKIENWVLTTPIAGFQWDKYFWWSDEDIESHKRNYRNDLIYLNQFTTFLQKLSQQKTAEDNLVIQLLLSYCYLLQGKENKALDNIQTCKAKINEPKLAIQAEIFEVIISFQKAHGRSKTAEQQLLALTQKLKKSSFLENPSRAIEQVWRTCGVLYRQHKDSRALGFLMTAQTSLVTKTQGYYEYDWYQNCDKECLYEIISLLENPNTDDFTRFVSSKSNEFGEPWYTDGKYNITTLKDYYGMHLVREKRMKEAYVWYSKFSIKELHQSPLNYQDNDPFIFRTSTQFQERYTKLDFLKKYLEYESSLRDNPNQPKLWYYLGNAWLNMSCHGNAWPMVSNHLSSGDTENDRIKEAGKNFVNGQNAIYYYQQGLVYVKDERLKALIQMNLAYTLGKVKKLNWQQEEKLLVSLCKNQRELDLLNEITSNCDVYADYLEPYITKGPRIKKAYYWTNVSWN